MSPCLCHASTCGSISIVKIVLLEFTYAHMMREFDSSGGICTSTQHSRENKHTLYMSELYFGALRLVYRTVKATRGFPCMHTYMYTYTYSIGRL